MTDAPLTKMPPGEWETHSLDTGEDHAAALFLKKHGYPPAQLLDVVFAEWRGQPWGVLAVGPINGKEARDESQTIRYTT